MKTLDEKLDFLAQMVTWDWPDEGTLWYREGLQSEDDACRLKAVQLSCYALVDESIAEILMHIVKTDKNPEIAAAAAIGLGSALEEYDIDEGIEDEYSETLSTPLIEAIQQTLKNTYYNGENDDLLRRRCLEAAVRAPQDWQVKETRAAFASPGKDWRVTALFCMGQLDGFDDEILNALADSNEEIQREAILSAGHRELVQAAPFIVDVATNVNQDLEMRLAAISALGSLSSPDVIELLEQLSHDKDEDIAATAENAMEELVLISGMYDPDDDIDIDVDDEWED